MPVSPVVAVEGVEADEEKSDEEEEGARSARVLRDPGQPNDEEMKEHDVTHQPYRSWCPHCVKGQLKANAHRGHDRGKNKVPTFSMDYF